MNNVRPIRPAAMNLILTIAGIITFAFLALPARALDWPQWRGPNRTGLSEETAWSSQWPAEGPKRVWEANVGVGYASMSVSQGKLFTMGNVDEVDHVYCLDASSGKQLWQHEYPCSSQDPNGYPGTRCT